MLLLLILPCSLKHGEWSIHFALLHASVIYSTQGYPSLLSFRPQFYLPTIMFSKIHYINICIFTEGTYLPDARELTSSHLSLPKQSHINEILFILDNYPACTSWKCTREEARQNKCCSQCYCIWKWRHKVCCPFHHLYGLLHIKSLFTFIASYILFQKWLVTVTHRIQQQKCHGHHLHTNKGVTNSCEKLATKMG